MFDGCEVPAENVVGAVGGGVQVLMSGLDYERAVLSGGAAGLMQSCLDAVMPYVHQREQFGRPIGSFPAHAGQTGGHVYTTLNACRAYAYAVARACDRGGPTRKDAAGAILYTA